MAGIVNIDDPIGKPWRFTGTEMRPNLLLMCKLLLALLLLHGFSGNLREPFLPFLPPLDLLRSDAEWFARMMQLAFFAAGCCLVFNYRVRWAAIVLGVVATLALVASKTLFRNHIFIVGCLFFLAGLQRKEEEPWLLRWQMVVIYAGAFLNKILQVDWRSGQFMHHWLHTELANPYYEALRPHLPEPGFAILISWAVIASELVLAVLFSVRRWNTSAVVLTVSMHLVFFVLVGRTIFGHFTEDVLIAMLAFLRWPAAGLALRLNPSLHPVVATGRAWFDWDREWTHVMAVKNPGNWLEVDRGGRPLENRAAALNLVKYNAAFYCGVFAVFNGAAYLISRY